MSRVIELPDGQQAEFPDSMSLDQIKAVISKKFPSPNAAPVSSNNPMPQPKPGLLEQAGNFAEKEINQPTERYITNPLASAAGGFEQGLANIVPGAINAGSWGINKLAGTNIPKVPMFDFAPHNTASDVGNMSSFFSGPGIAKAIGRIPELANIGKGALSIPMIAKGLTHAQNMLNKSPFASKVAGNALWGATYSPDNPLIGASVNAAFPIVGKGLEKAYNTLRPSNLLKSNLTPAELNKNLEITAGTETGLGDVIGSPMLKRLNENILSKIPFSGANEAMMKSAGNVVEQGQGILNKLLGKNKSEDFEQTLNDTLKNVYEKHQVNKTNLYKEANKIAKDINLELPLENFSNKAKNYSEALENTNILKYEPEMASMINKLKNYKNPSVEKKEVSSILDKQGNPIINKITKNYPTLKEANLLKGKLNQLADQYSNSPTMTDRHASLVFRELSSSLKQDINYSIKNKGNNELKKAYEKAEENYSNNFSPFLDKEIYKFASGNGDADTLISSFIKTGKSNDRANLINKLTKKLPPEKRNLLGYGYLQRAIDENNVLNPLKLKTLLSRNALGPRQLKSLFPDPEIRNSLLNYGSLIEKNTKGLKLMQNPETGQMNMDILPLLSKSPIGLAGKIIGAKPVVNFLTNPKTREDLVRKMIAKKEARTK